jgi:ssDNA-binding Zn-finger/Zn-ribbon topoisomerase 1
LTEKFFQLLYKISENKEVVMFNIIALKVKCPFCTASLMDKDHTVDNEPGIKLDITIGSKQGHIWLSSIYESYNFVADIDIPNNEIAVFHCPHCHVEITSTDRCATCHAPLVPFHLEEGGKVSICSRAGCRKHSVAFEDLSTALGYFYDKYTYNLTEDIHFPPHAEEHKEFSEAEDDKEIIKTGSFLSSYCPHCRNSLIEDRMVKLSVENEQGEKGFLLLSPYLNVFSHKSTIKLPEKHTIKNIRCPHCDEQLFVNDKRCPVCDSEIARIQVAAMTRMIDFYICSKKGCTWHGLSDDDIQSIVLEDGKDW